MKDRVFKRLLAALLTICMLLGMVPGLPGLGVQQVYAATNATAYRGNIGNTYMLTITANKSAGSVWGTDIYTDDSAIEAAAVHAGVLADGATGTVTIQILAGQSSYSGSTRNGVTSSSYGAYGGSYKFIVNTDIAQGKTATASSILSASEAASYAVDGNSSTYWESAAMNGTPQWLMVDLGKKYYINGYELNGRSSSFYDTAFRFQGSNDGANFVDLDTVTSNPSYLYSKSITPVLYRYVRVYITQTYGGFNFATAADFKVYGTAASANGNLISLVPSTSSLSPVFASSTTTYSMSVSAATNSMTFTPTVEDTGKSTVTVNGSSMVSGAASSPINIYFGVNVIPIVVTAEDGTTKAYTVTVTKSGTDIAWGKTAVASSILSASDDAPYAVDGNSSTYWESAAMNGTPQWLRVDLGTVDTINGYEINGRSAAYFDSAFKFQGSNDGTNFTDLDTVTGNNSQLYRKNLSPASYRYVRLYITQTYNGFNYATAADFKVYKATGSSNNNLSSLVPSTGELSPAFASGTTAYTIAVASDVSSITFTPTVEDTGKATVTVNGVPVTSGQASGPISLNTGSNSIPVVVTAQNGSTKTYTVTVIRAVGYTVTYNANGANSGSVPNDSNIYAFGTTVTVAGNTGNLAKTGYTFAGWNTQADGIGTDRAAASTFAMGTANVTLYAKWNDPTPPVWASTYPKAGNIGQVLVKTDKDGKAYYVVVADGAAAPSPAEVKNGVGKDGDLAVTFGSTNLTANVQAAIDLTGLPNTANYDMYLVAEGTGHNLQASVQKVDINNNILAYYRFEGNANDSSGNGKNGTIVGGVTFAPGFSGNAAVFNGTNSYITLPNDLLRSNTNFTVVLRFKTTGSGVLMGYQNASPSGAATSANEYIPFIYIGGNDGKLHSELWIYNQGEQPYNGHSMSVTSAGVVNDNRWHKVAVTASSSSIDVYIDDVHAGSNAVNGTTSYVAHLGMSYNQIGVGRNDFGRAGSNVQGWNYYNGMIDDLYVLARGVNSSEVAQLGNDAPQVSNINVSNNADGSNDSITVTGLASGDVVKVYDAATGGSMLGSSVVASDQTTATVQVPQLGTGAGSIYVSVTKSGGTESARTLKTYVAEPSFTVTYDGNGSDGGDVPVDGSTYAQGASVTVPGNPGGLVKTGYILTGWNTAADGSGTNYAFGSTLSVRLENVILYAMWELDLNPPAVSTNDPVTGITTATATAGGNVTANGGAPILERGVVYKIGAGPVTLENGTKVTAASSGMGEFTVSLTDLSSGTGYTVVAYATNAIGTSYGNEVSFTTLNPPPTVTTTTPATGISSIGATVGGTASGSGITAYGVICAVVDNPTLETAGLINGTRSGDENSFTVAFTGLTPGTKYYARAYATNAQGTTYGQVEIFTTPSDNNKLSNIVLSKGTLTPAFAQTTYAYAAQVENSVSAITLTPTLADGKASVTVEGSPVANGQASGSIPLNVGANTINIVVTAQDGTTRPYTVTVTRKGSRDAALSNLSLSEGTISPAFDKTVIAYTSTVGETVNTVNVTAVLSDANASMTINGSPAASGTPVAVNISSNNLVTIIVTPQDTASPSKTYTLRVLKQNYLSFKYDDFSQDTNLLQINNDASINNNELQLTPNITWKRGSAFYKKRLSLANQRSFSTFFTFNMSGRGGSGQADGITFAIQTVSNTAGSQGGGIGYQGLNPSVGIEFDSWYNRENQDPNSPHIGINVNGNIVSKRTQTTSPFDLRDGSVYYAWIDYDGPNKTIYVRLGKTPVKPVEATLTMTNLDLSSVLNMDEVYVGFTSATGGASQRHAIGKWYFNNDYKPIDTTQNTYTETPESVALASNPADTNTSVNTSVITASVYLKNGAPAANVPVIFSATRGTLSQTQVMTDSAGKASVTLTASGSCGAATIKAVAQGGAYGQITLDHLDLTDAESVATDVLNTKIGYAAGDSESSVTKNVTLPTAGTNDTTITWASDKPGAVSTTGVVVRPSYFDGDSTVTLTATISKGTQSTTKTFVVNIKRLPYVEPVLSIGSTTIDEAAANDGSITATQVVTISGGSFAESITAADITVNNLPSGLTAAVNRDSAIKLTISFTGKAAKHNLANSISNTSITIAKSKIAGTLANLTTCKFAISFKDPVRITTANAENGNNQVDEVKGSSAPYYSTGAIEGSITVTLENGTFAETVDPALVTVNNLPSGLTKTVNRQSDTKIVIGFTGNAANHENVNDVDNATITIGKDAIIGALGDVVSSTFKINFNEPEPYMVVTTPVLNESAANDGSITVTQVVTLKHGTFGNVTIADIAAVNLPAGLTVSGVAKDSVTQLTISFGGNVTRHLAENSVNNVYIKVAGSKVTPNEPTLLPWSTPVVSGSFGIQFINPPPSLSVGSAVINESGAKDATITDTQVISLSYGTFADNMTGGVFVNNLPEGLGFTVQRNSGTQITITFTGKALSQNAGAANASVTVAQSKIVGASTSVTSNTFEINCPSDAGIAYRDMNDLEIVYAEGDSAASVTKNVGLPSTGRDGSSITWSSSIPGTITAGGIVTRPSHTTGDKAVRLTATITKGTQTETKTFDVTVKKLGITDDEAIALDLAAVQVGYADGDNSSSVTQNVSLVSGGDNNTIITWTSSVPEVITTEGLVTRPSGANSTVTLAATVSKGSGTPQSVSFALTVIKKATATVTFVSNGGSAVDSITVDNNTTISEPSAPTRTGYTFGGWYTDDVTFNNAFDFATLITEDITLYAKWNGVTPNDSSITPITASFDRNVTNRANVDVTVNLNGNNFVSITNGGTQLVSGTDYTVTGSVYSITKEYLSLQPVGTTTLIFNFSAGNAQEIGITIIDTTPNSSSINPTTAGFDKKESAQADITVTMTLNGNTLTGITDGVTSLVFGTDYTVSDSTVTIKKEYLASKALGTTTLTFNFNAGSARTIAITIIDTTPAVLPTINVSNASIGESSANNGSVSGTQVVTLSNGTFAADMSSGVTINNLPAGLDINVTKDNDTQITINFTGNALRHESENSVSNASVTVSQSKIIGATGDVTSGTFGFSFVNQAQISISVASIEESAPYSTGAISVTQSVYLANGAFAAGMSSGVTVNNMPAGLGISIARISDVQIDLTFTGNAINHANADDVLNASVTIAQNKIVGAVGDLTSNTFKIDFNDPEPVFAVGTPVMTESSANDGSIMGTQRLTLLYGTIDPSIATADVIPVNLPSGLGISAVRVGSTELDITFTGAANSHSDANNVQSVTFAVYGAKITPTASGLTVADVVYSNSFAIDFINPYPTISVGSLVINETAANDGSFTATQAVTVANGTFSADMSSGVTVNNLPVGLGITVLRNSDTQITISFTGNATNHSNAYDISNASITIDQNKIVGAAVNVTSGTFAFDFHNASPAYTVSYNVNGATGGTAPTDSNTYNQGSTVTVLGNTGNLVKDGFTFVGWNTAVNGSGTSYAAGATFAMGTSNVTLYARWTTNSYTVVFNSNGGSAVASQTVNYNSSATQPAAPSKAGYNFAGWYTNEALTNAFNFATAITSDVSLYARWTPLPSIQIASSTIRESAANDGSISEVQVVTLSDGSFAADMSSGVTVNNLPAGLGISVVRNSATQITISFTGHALNHAAANSLTNMSVSIDQAKITGATGNISSASFGMDFINPYPTIVVQNGTINESVGNDGSIVDSQVVTLTNGTFVQDLSSGVTVNNLPAGLSYNVVRNNGTQLTITFTGKATNHASDVGNASVSIAAAKIIGAVSDAATASFTFNFNSNTPSIAIASSTVKEAVANDGSILEPQVVELKDGVFAANMADGITVNNLPTGLGISVTRNSNTKLTIRFTGRANAHASANDVSNASVTIASSKISSAAANVTSDTFSIDFSDPAVVPELKIGRTVIKEAAANDGSFTETQTVTLTGGIFTQDAADGVTINNLPQGLSASVVRNSDTKLTVTFTGRANSHSDTNDINNAYIAVAQSKIIGAAQNISSDPFTFDFIDPYPTISVNVPVINEAGDNDGSIKDVQVVKLVNGTFAEDMSSGVTVDNLPQGLGIKVTRDSDTQISVSFTGNAASHGNANYISNASITIEKSKIIGAVSATTSGAFAISFNDPDPVLTVQSSSISEAAANDGSITAVQVITLQNGFFAADMTSGVTVNNLPYGLGFTVARNSDTQITISFTGAAERHSQENSVQSASVTISKTKINGAKANLTSGSFSITFIDPVTLNVAQGVVSEPAPLNSGAISGQLTVRLTNGTFAADMSSGVSVVNIPAGLGISVTRDSNTQITISFTGNAASHTNADDVINAYVSIAQHKVIGALGTVNSNTFKINFNDPEPFFTAGTAIVKEASTNNGSITEKQIFTLQYGQLAQNITLADVTASYLPTGLTIGSVTRLNGAQLEIGFAGAAASHTALDNARNVSISVNKDVVVPTQDGLVLTSNVPSGSFEIRFINPYPSIIAASSNITEANANDGSITDVQVINLANGTFAADMNGGVVINNLPEGLGYTVTRDSDTQLTVTFTGKALNHANTNDVDNASIQVAKAKVVGAVSDLTTGNFKFDFANPVIPGDVNDDVDRLNIIYADGDNADHVTKSVFLTEKGTSGNTTISWHSSNESLVKATGRVTRPGPEGADTSVTLTATITHKVTGAQRTKVFTIKVLKLSDDEAVQDAAKKLTGAEAFKFAEGDAWECVTSEFVLLTAGAHGTSISWSSSNTGIISITSSGGSTFGAITRPSNKDENVILTATITKGSSVITKTFLLVVKNTSVAKEANSTRQETTRQVDVTVNPDGTVDTEKVEVLRTTLNNEAKIDTVVVSAEKVETLTDNINPQEADSTKRTVNITMTQPANDKADELAFEIPATAVNAMSEKNAILNIKSDEGGIKLDKASVDSLSDKGTDLYFRIVPIKDINEQTALKNQMLSDNTVKLQITDKKVNALGIPRKIETNYSGVATKVVLPLSGITIPTENRQEYLDSLRIYIQHTDGTTEFIPGVVQYENGQPVGIEFQITKFSSFQLVNLSASSNNNSGNDNGGNDSGTTETPKDSGKDVIGDSRIKDSVEVVKNPDGSVKIVVGEKIKDLIKDEKPGVEIVIPVVSDSKTITVDLRADTLKNLTDKEAVLVVEGKNGTAVIPASEIKLDTLADALGKPTDLKDVIISITISASNSEAAQKAIEQAEKIGAKVVLNPINIKITASCNGKTAKMDKFDHYITQMIPIPEGVDYAKITTAVYVDDKGGINHVPTVVTIINGRYYAKINCFYTGMHLFLIWNPIEFKDVEKHWAKDDVNDMSSRLVVFGGGNNQYAPDKDITRAEFAAIMIRALGLRPGEGKNIFKDVDSKAWYCGYIQTAYKYGIIGGYGNGKFGPLDKITREQAIAIIARTMKMTGLKVSLKNGEAKKLLEAFGDSNKSYANFRESIAVCTKTGIIPEQWGKILAPKKKITRAEVAVMVRRFLQMSKLIN